MKKILILMLALALLCGVFAGCAKEKPDSGNETTKQTETTKQAETTNPEKDKKAFTGTEKEVLDAIIAKAIELDTDKEYGIKSIACTDTYVDDDSCTNILGLTTEEFRTSVEAAIESKPDGSWFTHSVVVIKIKSGTDTAKLADTIIEKTNPSRFGCLKPEAIVGCYAGDYIIFTASAQTSCEAVFGAVQALSSVEPVRIDRENDWSGGGMMGFSVS